MKFTESLQTALAVATFFAFLFEYADRMIDAPARTSVYRWLTNIATPKEHSSWPRVFIAVFDSVFGVRHLSMRRFAMSAASSFVAGLVVALIYSNAVYGVLSHLKGWALAGAVLRLFAIVPLLNTVVDFVSICETRIVMGLLERGRTHVARLGCVLLDVVLTTAVHVGFVLLGAAALLVLAHLGWRLPLVSLDAWGVSARDVFASIVNTYRDALQFKSTVHSSFAISLYTTYITSVWLWLYFVSGYVIKFQFHARKALLPSLRPSWVRRHPLRVMGFASAVVILGAWCVVTVIAVVLT